MKQDKPIRVRMAPSPTGFLHIGGARTALFNYLFSKHYKATSGIGTFVLRIEDTDRERSKKEYEDEIIEDLKWLGVTWDEGPIHGGPYGPYYQSERLDIYAKYLKKLKDLGKTYECYCTPEELEIERQDLLKRHKTPRYMGKCRNLTQEEILEFKSQTGKNRQAVIRFRVDETKPIQFYDLVRGDISVDPAMIGDFVISKADGMPLYNFAAVVDDYEMKISHVIRGEEHISNTPRQILLAQQLGFELPNYAHVSIILAPDRSKLSKRHGATAVGDYRKEGYLPEALKNYLALLGWNPGDEREIMSEKELIEGFVIERLVKSPAIFDVEKLKWMNGQYIKTLPIETIVETGSSFLAEDGFDLKNKDKEWLSRVVGAVRGNLETLKQMGPACELFFDEKFTLSDEVKNQLSLHKENALKILKMSDEVLAKISVLNEETFQQFQKQLKETFTDTSKKVLFPIQRWAFTGRMKGPELHLVLPILGIKSCRYRLGVVILYLESQ